MVSREEQEQRDRITANATAALNKILLETGLLSVMPRYRYWQLTSRDFKRHGYKGKKFIDRFAFAYTTERTSDGFFWAIIYRIKKTKNGETWHMTRKSHRRQRKKAKALAYSWYCKREELLKKRLTLQGKIKEVC